MTVKIRWIVTPVEPTGADVTRYFTRPTRTEGIKDARRRVAEFTHRNKIVRFLYSVNYKDSSGRWRTMESSSQDSIAIRELLAPMQAADLEAAAAAEEPEPSRV